MASGQDVTTATLDPSLTPRRENQEAFSSRSSKANVLECITSSYVAKIAIGILGTGSDSLSPFSARCAAARATRPDDEKRLVARR
jgi:hypothetical protein